MTILGYAQEVAPQDSFVVISPPPPSDTISPNPPPPDSTPIEKPVSLLSHYPLRHASEEWERPGVALPFYDPLDNAPEVIWRLSYFKPYYAPLGVPSSETSLWQASMGAYTLSGLSPLRVKKPVTRLRFDQSSRRTQLLSVDHAQNFSPKAGIRATYQRRTRIGEYLGQTTDHYNIGFLLYGETQNNSTASLRLYGFTQVLWNQLFDEINGGSVWDSAQGLANAFQKESQPVRFTNGQWRSWYRLLWTEGGLVWGAPPSEKLIGVQAQVRQLYGGWRSGPARIPTSPFGTDTASSTTFAFGEEQRLGLRTAIGPGELTLSLLRWWGKGENWQAFDKQAITGQFHLEELQLGRFSTPKLEIFYRRWLSLGSPPPELHATLLANAPLFTNLSALLSLQYQRSALPWFFYQRYAILRPRNPEYLLANYAISWIDKGQNPIPKSTHSTDPLPNGRVEIRFWGLRQRWLLLTRKSHIYQSEAALFWYGLRLSSRWSGRYVGMYSAVLFQRPIAPDTLQWWTRQMPSLTGWIQIHYQWRIPPFTPLYRLGVRIRGSNAYHPPQYEPAYALFFAADDTPRQSAWAALDAFLIVSLQQVDFYLRVDHAAEGLLQPGSFWTYPYPVPGRAFSFGFVWDLYN